VSVPTQVERFGNSSGTNINLSFYLLMCVYFSFFFLSIHEQCYSKMVYIPCVHSVFLSGK
jgi:hypothetical protein